MPHFAPSAAGGRWVKGLGSKAVMPLAACDCRIPAESVRRCTVHKDRQTDRVVSALQPTWLIGLGRARTRDQPVSRRKGFPDRFRGSPPRSSVDALPDLIVLFLPCQVVPLLFGQSNSSYFCIELGVSSDLPTNSIHFKTSAGPDYCYHLQNGVYGVHSMAPL